MAAPDNPRILFLAVTNDVGANRVVAAMAAAGARCAVMSPPGYFSARSAATSVHFLLPQNLGLWLAMLAIPRALERAVRDWRPDWIVPLDDMASWQLRSLVQTGRVSPALHALVVRSLGAETGYAVAVSRAELLALAAERGIRVPPTVPIRSIEDGFVAAARLGYPLMLKLEHTCGGAGVRLVHSENELEAGLRDAGLDGNLSVKRLRTALKLGVWSWAGVVGLDAAPAGLQARVDGRLAMRTVAAIDGEVLAGVNFEAVAVHPEPTGASTVLRAIEHAEMERAAKVIIAALGASGFLSFDFLLSPTDRAATLIELNARPVGSTHLGALVGHDVISALTSHIAGRPLSPQRATPTRVPEIALFPKELERDPASPRFAPGADVLHDVPWDDPPAVTAYRAWLAHKHPLRGDEIDTVLDNSWPAEAIRAAALQRYPDQSAAAKYLTRNAS